MRARILDAAYGVLCEQGYDKLTQLAVCKAAAISQGHLTYYFPTRAALQLGLAQHCVYREVEQMVQQMLAGGAPPSRSGLAAAMAGKLRDRNKPRVMAGLLIAADGDARIKPAVREFIANARKMVARVLEQCGVEATESNITLLHASLIGLAMLNFALDEEDFSASIEGAVTTLLHNWEKVGQDHARRTP
jgi:AcrR family transcriptional regulator